MVLVMEFRAEVTDVCAPRVVALGRRLPVPTLPPSHPGKTDILRRISAPHLALLPPVWHSASGANQDVPPQDRSAPQATTNCRAYGAGGEGARSWRTPESQTSTENANQRE